ncbi:MAG TPA: hypothetical protein VMD02_01745 [Candidatus Omnitrophota bacterium]|nr:hypothetical protein [Candidatus Omnitrophota bacterium]
MSIGGIVKAMKEIMVSAGRALKRRIVHRGKYLPRVLPAEKGSAVRGTVLLSYHARTVAMDENDPYLDGHSSKWESREIARIFHDLGYRVEAIDWDNRDFVPQKEYEVIFDIGFNLQRLSPMMKGRTLKLFHCTGSFWFFQNQQELLRVEAMEKRRNAYYSPKRLVIFPELQEKSLKMADLATLVGNERTLNTYPERYRSKMTTVPVSSSKLLYVKKNDLVPEKREFLWYFGSGAVHKGLDLLLEIFSRNLGLVLNVVGWVGEEKDFIGIYQRELFSLPNIKFHGPLNPNSKEFKRLLDDVFCFIAPSCSEGISPACVTCLQAGLYPVISRQTGIDLPQGAGHYLEDCSQEEIEAAIRSVHSLDGTVLARQISACQEKALNDYSRENYSARMRKFLERATSE